MARGEPTVGEGLQSSLVGTSPRTHGTTQVTYKGMPLYRFAGDAKAGDTKGQGLNRVWWVVAPTAPWSSPPRTRSPHPPGGPAGSPGLAARSRAPAA
jgi:hypothetical protein